ncbi:MAG: adenylate kinase [Chlamydiales bacterium]|jgi:adenylate kinase|nr:adenylate kinase [Chlamydiales bacterium]
MNSTLKRPVIILLGPPGCGKGTQAKKLAHELGLPHISTGDLFRQCLADGESMGGSARQCRELIKEGKLVPDSITLEMLGERLKSDDCAHGYILDGFPRTLPQAEAFMPKLGLFLAVNFSIRDEKVIQRIEGRMTCKGCGAVYNTYFSPPKGELCDLCNSELIKRADDHWQAVEKRLQVYRAQTEPLIEYYNGQKALATVEADQTPEQVFQAILALLNAKGIKKTS